MIGLQANTLLDTRNYDATMTPSYTILSALLHRPAPGSAISHRNSHDLYSHSLLRYFCTSSLSWAPTASPRGYHDMRLLQATGEDDFSLVEYIDDIPPYAILSHTWGPDHEEVTFKDIFKGKGKGKTKLGYAKLRFCATQAAKEGLAYFWARSDELYAREKPLTFLLGRYMLHRQKQ